MRYAASAAYTGMGFGFWPELGVVFASTIAYLTVGFWLFILVEKKARRDASLVEY
jgi:hypothetical protein